MNDTSNTYAQGTEFLRFNRGGSPRYLTPHCHPRKKKKCKIGCDFSRVFHMEAAMGFPHGAKSSLLSLLEPRLWVSSPHSLTLLSTGRHKRLL